MSIPAARPQVRGCFDTPLAIDAAPGRSPLTPAEAGPRPRVCGILTCFEDRNDQDTLRTNPPRTDRGSSKRLAWGRAGLPSTTSLMKRDRPYRGGPCVRRSAPPNAIRLAVLRSPDTSTEAPDRY